MEAQIKQPLLRLVFPRACSCCELELLESEEVLCCFCEGQLSWTYCEAYDEPDCLPGINAPIFSALSFKKGGMAQILIHELKYKNGFKTGQYLGRLMACRFEKHKLQSIQCLIPVPIHHRKAFTRGYNQSFWISKGLSQVWHIPIVNDFLIKSKRTESQTKKTKEQRHLNVQGSFRVCNQKAQRYNHIALVDDVVTTGATIAAIVNEIRHHQPNIQITIFALAVAK